MQEVPKNGPRAVGAAGLLLVDGRAAGCAEFVDLTPGVLLLRADACVSLQASPSGNDGSCVLDRPVFCWRAMDPERLHGVPAQIPLSSGCSGWCGILGRRETLRGQQAEQAMMTSIYSWRFRDSLVIIDTRARDASEPLRSADQPLQHPYSPGSV